jgi:hypothetical protein
MGLSFLFTAQAAHGSVVAQDSEESKESPVKRVVGLLEKMKGELQTEADHEAEMYDKMVCWCETNEKEKTTAVAQAEATIVDLQAEIEQRSARFGELGTEIEAMKKQIAEDTATLKEATKIREGDAGSFRDEEKAQVQAITNLKNAIAVLGKHQGLQRGLKDPKGAGLVQLSGPELMGFKIVLRDLIYRHELMVAGQPERASFLQVDSSSSTASLSQMLGAVSANEQGLPLKFAEKVLARAAAKAADGSSASFLQAKQPMSQSYASQSDGIFGILTTMLDEFEADLKASQTGEGSSASDFEALAKAKTEQIAVGKEKLDELEGNHAGNQKALSDAKENLQLTTDQRAADVEFLRNLKLTCNDLDAQWEARSKTRSDEIVAVAETITILTSDDNHEQLKAGGVAMMQSMSLLQVDETSAMRARRVKAADALRAAAQAPAFEGDDLLAAWRSRAHASVSSVTGPRAQLSTLAVSVQLDAFTKVKAMIDTLLAELKDQQAEEVQFKAYCIKELDQNEKATFDKSEQKEDLETRIKQLAALMEKLASEIAEANVQIADSQLEVKKASQVREDENQEFQTVVSDQRATQTILTKALQRLKDFYATRLSGRALLQVSGKQTPPVQFNSYKNNAGASPVMGLIEQIIEDSKALEKEAITGEYQAQADYEKMVKDSNALVSDLTNAVTSKTKASAQAKMDQEAASSGLDMANDELESLAAYEADLHHQCDFVTKNFDIRQKARLQEMEAITQAKAILSGSQ